MCLLNIVHVEVYNSTYIQLVVVQALKQQIKINIFPRSVANKKARILKYIFFFIFLFVARFSEKGSGFLINKISLKNLGNWVLCGILDFTLLTP